MAITGNWVTAHIQVAQDGTIHFQAGVDLVDDALGQVGHRALTAAVSRVHSQCAQTPAAM